jgi:outer membrane protein OmpA-like peptidoglycan-associated protein
MKKQGFALLVLSVWAIAQQPQQPSAPAQTPVKQSRGASVATTPTPSDLYCSGFITTEKIPEARYVVGGLDTPHQSQYSSLTANIFVHGQGMKEGDRFEFVREVKDPDHFEAYSGQHRAIRYSGRPYFELGYAKVIGVQKNIAILQPELSCAGIVPGDIAIPFVERPAPTFRNVTLDRLAPPNGKAMGWIVMGNEFDDFLGSTQKAYLDIGADKGLQPGDYLRAVRTYSYLQQLPAEGLSFKATELEDTQMRPRKVKATLSELPRRVLGDMIVLHVHPKSATVMVMTALETISVGDAVEVMDIKEEAPAPVAAAPAPVETAVATPPTITCSASPANIRLDESSTITCDAASPDNRPLTITFTSSAGKLSVNKNVAVLNSSTSGPGQISVRATAVDDRQLSASANATINVEPPPPAPTAQKMNDLDFKPNSAYVNNRSKAILDDVALKLQQDPGSTVVLSGSKTGKEPASLAEKRAKNAADYLTKSKGIDAKRIQTRVGSAAGDTVEVWTVPAGASAPPQ